MSSLSLISRRKFLQTGGRGVVGVSLATSGEFVSDICATNHRGQWGMLIWLAHSLSYPLRKHLKVDREYIRGMMAYCADHGITSIYWRGSYVGKSTYPTGAGEAMTRLEPDYFERLGLDRQKWEATLHEFNGMAEIIASLDTMEAGLAEAKSRGLRFYADIAPFDRYFPGLENRFFDQQPQYWLLARDQKTRWRGIPCYAEKGAQDYVLSEIEELLKRGVDGISFHLGSHAAGGGHGLEYGFSPTIVNTYRQRYGVNILEQDFDRSKLHVLAGQLYTDFLRRVRKAIGTGRKFFCAATLDGLLSFGELKTASSSTSLASGEGQPSYRVVLEWEKWVKEGIADGLLIEPSATPDAVEQIKRIFKSKVRNTPVFLFRETDKKEEEELYRKEFAAIRAGKLDGIIIDELKDYYPQQYWSKLLE